MSSGFAAQQINTYVFTDLVDFDPADLASCLPRCGGG